MQNEQNQQEEDDQNEGKYYQLTVKGLFMVFLREKEADLLFNGLELYLRRTGLGIVVDNNKMRFVELQKVDC